jgi:hypothetical protein
LAYSRSMSIVQTDVFSPSQIEEPMTTMFAALTRA